MMGERRNSEADKTAWGSQMAMNGMGWMPGQDWVCGQQQEQAARPNEGSSGSSKGATPGAADMKCLNNVLQATVSDKPSAVLRPGG